MCHSKNICSTVKWHLWVLIIKSEIGYFPFNLKIGWVFECLGGSGCNFPIPNIGRNQTNIEPFIHNSKSKTKVKKKGWI